VEGAAAVICVLVALALAGLLTTVVILSVRAARRRREAYSGCAAGG
jgi:hypothetical protein